MLELKSMIEDDEEKIEEIYNDEHDFIFELDINSFPNVILRKLYDLAIKLYNNDKENYEKMKIEYVDIISNYMMINYIETNVYTDPNIKLCKKRPQTIEISKQLLELVEKIREYQINESRWKDTIEKISKELSYRNIKI